MAISYIDAAGAGGNPTTSYSITIPAGTGTNDLLLLFVVNRAAGIPTLPTDDDSGGNVWALLCATTDNTIRALIYTKVATAGTASKTISGTGLTDSCSAGVAVYRGAYLPGVFSTEPHPSGTEIHQGITTTVNGAMVILFVANSANEGASTTAATDPASLTAQMYSGSTGGSDCFASVAGAIRTNAGATGQFSWTQADATTVSIVLWLTPTAPVASGGGPVQLVNLSGLVG